MSFFAIDKTQQAQRLANQLRVRLEQLRDDRLNRYIYLTSTNKAKIELAAKSRGVDPIFTKRVARHLYNCSITNQLKARLLPHPQQTVNTMQIGTTVNEVSAFRNEAERLINSSPWWKSKDHFSWDCFKPAFLLEDEHPYLAIENAAGQAFYYNNLLEQAISLEAELLKESPNYLLVATKIKDIRATTWQVESVMRQNSGLPEIPLRVTYFFGHNIISHLFFGVIGIVAASVAFTLGLLFAVPAYFLESPYFGTSTFLLDAAKHGMNSLINVVSSILFPVAILYALYTTNSPNVFKGDLARALDTLESFCDEESHRVTPANDPVSLTTSY